MYLAGQIAQPQTLRPAGPLIFGIGAAEHGSRTPPRFRRFVFAIAAFTALPPLLLAAPVIAVDPHYVFGSPSWGGFNAVRPYYEPHVIMAKPYQVRRQRPSAVALGSSRVEVGIDPRHGGWIDNNVFNFAMPSSNSYAVMLAFLQAQKSGAPLKQAAIGLDFFAYNMNFPMASDLSEQRFADGVVEAFATFLDGALAERQKNSRPATPNIPAAPQTWNEALYLAVNPDVAAAVARKEFKSGHEHWDLAGRAEHRAGATVPAEWDEAGYLWIHPDVAAEVSRGTFVSGYHHYLAAGRFEGRLGGFPTKDWNEALSLGIGERYEFWLKELVRINEEEAARAGRQSFPLWDFSDPNTITRDPVPLATDPGPMQWYWEHSHYRKVAGDLILDRIFGHREPGRPLPSDFGVRLAGGNIGAHIARARTNLKAWASANSDLVAPIVRAAQTSKTHSHQAETTCW